MIETLKLRMLNEAFNLAGMFIAGQITKPDYDAQEKLLNTHYTEIKAIARKQEIELEKQGTKTIEQSIPTISNEPAPITITMPAGVEEGTVCVACSRDHFSTVAGALNEALRFARKEGTAHPEVMRRMGLALDELNICERMDLSSENIVKLQGMEKQLAEWGLNASRDLRHEITAVRSPADLERTAAHASNIRTEYMRQLWDLTTADGTIDRLCKGLKDEEKERCITAINAVLVEKKEKPP